VGLENFIRVFHLRYGSTGPILYIGKLEQAIQDSLYGPIHEVNHRFNFQFVALFFD
jgi:hypothetical protein